MNDIFGVIEDAFDRYGAWAESNQLLVIGIVALMFIIGILCQALITKSLEDDVEELYERLDELLGNMDKTARNAMKELEKIKENDDGNLDETASKKEG